MWNQCRGHRARAQEPAASIRGRRLAVAPCEQGAEASNAGEAHGEADMRHRTLRGSEERLRVIHSRPRAVLVRCRAEHGAKGAREVKLGQRSSLRHITNGQLESMRLAEQVAGAAQAQQQVATQRGSLRQPDEACGRGYDHRPIVAADAAAGKRVAVLQVLAQRPLSGYPISFRRINHTSPADHTQKPSGSGSLSSSRRRAAARIASQVWSALVMREASST